MAVEIVSRMCGLLADLSPYPRPPRETMPGAVARPIALLCLALGFLGGCQHAGAPTEIVWPAPPEPARIRYVRPIRNSDDVARSGTLQALGNLVLGGREEALAIQKPYGLDLDPSGRLLVADSGWGKVLVFDFPKRQFGFLWEGPEGELAKPAGIAVDRDGTIYVSDLRSHQVYVFDSQLEFQRTLGSEGRFGQPVGLAVDRGRRRVYVVDTNRHEVAVFDHEGREMRTIGRRGEGDGEFNFPSNVAVASNGNVYVVDTFNFRVQRFDAEGRYIGQFGRFGDLPGTFSRPRGIAIDPDGMVYVVDAAFHNVQVFTPNGRLVMFFGGVGRDLGQLYLPSGIHITADGTVYVSSQLNHRVDELRLVGSGSEIDDASDR